MVKFHICGSSVREELRREIGSRHGIWSDQEYQKTGIEIVDVESTHDFEYIDDNRRYGKSGLSLKTTEDLKTPLDNTKSLNWVHSENGVVVCDDRDFLRRTYGLEIDKDEVALRLATNLPFPLQHRTMWRGMSTANPDCRIYMGSDELEHVADPTKPASGDDLKEKLRNAVLSYISSLSSVHPTAGCDLSGGMDSGTVSVIAKSMFTGVHYYRFKDTSPNSDDELYAKQLARYLNSTINTIDTSLGARNSFRLSYPHAIPGLGEAVSPWGGFESYDSKLFSTSVKNGDSCYMTGLGGDDLYSNFMSLGAALLRERRFSEAKHELNSLRGAMGKSWAGLLRNIFERDSYHDELERRLFSPEGVTDPVADLIGWAPGFKVPEFVSEEAKSCMSNIVYDRSLHGPLSNYRHVHNALSAAMRQGELVRTLERSFGAREIKITAPLMCPQALAAIRDSNPSDLVSSYPTSKELLRKTFSGIVPSWLLNRATKTEFSSDAIAEYVGARKSLKRYLCDGILASFGFIDKDCLVKYLESPVFDNERIHDLAVCVNVERWLRELK